METGSKIANTVEAPSALTINPQGDTSMKSLNSIMMKLSLGDDVATFIYVF